MRTKTTSLLVGTALALGSILGVAAQTTAETSATLLENTAANGGNGICAASVTSRDFGDFRWDGDTYVGTFTGAFQITTTQTISPAPVDCDYTFTGVDLTLDGEADVISADEIQLTNGVDAQPAVLSGENTFTKRVETGEGTMHWVDYDVSDALDVQTPGEYSGQVTITTIGRSPGGN